MKEIDTYLYTGFLDSGKTTYIQDNLFHDYFYKHGTTLILSFEEGEASYDAKALGERRCVVSYYRDSEDITAFCLRQLKQVQPDRVIIEDNVMMENLPQQLPPQLAIRAKTALISGATLPVYFNNMRGFFTRILRDAKLVVFNRAETKEELAVYSTPFRLISPLASYLWESPLGFHEKAFGIPLTFDRSRKELNITADDYSCFYLDSLERPEDYSGKLIDITLQIQNGPEDNESYHFGSRKVFTCCMADIQDLGFWIAEDDTFQPELYGWYHLRAQAYTATVFHQKRIALRVIEFRKVPAAVPELIGYISPSTS